jgi:methylglyoxal synthase
MTTNPSGNSMKKIALIAHDARKQDMIEFVHQNLDILKKVELVATGSTGEKVQEAGLEVERKLSGPMGGDAQIAAMVAEKQLDAVVFFRDPLGKNPHEPDVQMLMRICDLHQVPLATNPSTAYYLIQGLTSEKKEMA